MDMRFVMLTIILRRWGRGIVVEWGVTQREMVKNMVV